MIDNNVWLPLRVFKVFALTARRFAPRQTSLTCTANSLAHTLSILKVSLVGITVIFIPREMVPLSTFPMAMVPVDEELAIIIHG